jgi:transcriptional regulator with XRE-family HTH domain
MTRTPQQAARFEALRTEAVALRQAGKSRMQIKEILDIRSNGTLSDVLKGTVPPEALFRPNAKDDLHHRARELRAQGWTYKEISAELGVSKSSISLWVRDLPREGRLSYEESRKRNDEGRRRYWEEERPIREAARQAISDAAAAEIGQLTDREILMLGAIAYWCEGAKNKPHHRYDRVSFINSDPGLIRFFLRFLEVAGVDPKDLVFRVMIHESADSQASHLFWQEITRADPSLFGKPTFKRHNPKTVRHNVGDDYHGCLRIDVRRSTSLYRQIEGWMRGMVDEAGSRLA